MSTPIALSLRLTNKDLQRFMSRVDQIGECWLWTGSRNRQGYGGFCIAGVTRRAHRVSYAALVAPIPAGQLVCHRCDTPSCVRPEHLFLGSYRENTADSIAKGRFRKVAPAQRQTHCRQGHVFTPENTMPKGASGGRRCRICSRAADRALKQRHRAA